MLSRAQQIRLKRAQREAQLMDADYRDAIATVSGMSDCRSSTDPRLIDGHFDNLLSYFEAIFWRRIDAGEIAFCAKPGATFQHRGYWAAKNRRGDNSRDRYVASTLEDEVAVLEDQLATLGCEPRYFEVIRSRMQRGGKPFRLVEYAYALRRTLSARQRSSNCPL